MIDIIWITIKKHYILTICMFIMIIMTIIFNLLPPVILGNIVDMITHKEKISLSIAILYFISILLFALSDCLKELIINIFGQNIIYNTRKMMIDKISKLDTAYLIENDPTIINSIIINDVNSLERLFSSGIISIIADSFKLISIIIVIFTKSYMLALLLLLVSPMVFYITILFQKNSLKAQLQSKKAIANCNKQIYEAIENIQTIKLLPIKTYIKNNFAQTINDYYDQQNKVNFYDSIYSPIIITISSIIVAIVMLMVSNNYHISQLFGISVGSCVTLISYITSFFSPIENIGMELQNIQSAIATTKRINEFLNIETTKKQNKELTNNNQIIFEHVSFHYPNSNKMILQDFNLTINNNEKILISGATGKGKSTIIKLILGAYSPQEGRILVNNIDPSHIKDEDKRYIFGYVEQRFSMIAGTIADQISLHDKRITEKQILNALHTVGLDNLNIHEVFDPNNFSFGQLQLLAIARAIVYDPKILLLDEISANLDNNTERKILEAINLASKNKMVISISHRLYTNDHNYKHLTI